MQSVVLLTHLCIFHRFHVVDLDFQWNESANLLVIVIADLNLTATKCVLGFVFCLYSGYARARIRVCAHEIKQVLSTLFSGGYECPYEDGEYERR